MAYSFAKKSGDFVGTAAVLFGQRPVQLTAFQALRGGVERTEAERCAGRLVDVLDEGVAVLRPASQAGQDENAGVGEPAEAIHVERSLYRRAI